MKPHDGVVIEEPAGIGSIGPDTTDNRCKVDDHLGLGLFVKTDDGITVAQVILFGAGHNHVSTAALVQLFHDERAEEACPAGDDDRFIRPKAHHNVLQPAATLLRTSSLERSAGSHALLSL